MQKHIFREFDIRGIVPTELSMQDSFDFAKACVAFFSQKCLKLQRIAVAFDGRIQGHEIYAQISQAIVDCGYQVYFLGTCPTSVFMYGLHQLPVQAGIMITASGSAAEYNGFKLYVNKNLVYGADLLKIYEIYEQQRFIKLQKSGKIIPCPIIEQYIDAIWQEFAHLSEYDFPVLIDCGNGSTGSVIKKLIQRMGWKQTKSICDAVDGTFPMHDPEPMDLKNMLFLQSQLKKNKQEFGIAFDGDGDRMLVMQSNGSMILGDRLMVIFAQDILARNAYRAVVHDMPIEFAISEIIGQEQSKLICVNSASITLLQGIQKHNAIFAAQLHGRFFFKDRHPGYPDGIYAMLRLFDLLVKQRISLSDLIDKVDQQMRQVPFYGTNDAVQDIQKL